MRLPLFSWTNTLRKLGFSHRRRPITTAKLRKEAHVRLKCEQLEPRHMLSVFSIADGGASENAGQMTLWVSRDMAMDTASVHYRTVAAQTGNPATPGVD